MFEQDAARLIRDQGWKIIKGPYANVRLLSRGVYMWSIKSCLSATELRERGIRIDKNGKQGDCERTVRFLGEVKDGHLVSVRHILTSERKKIGGRAWRPGRKAKKGQANPTK